MRNGSEFLTYFKNIRRVISICILQVKYESNLNRSDQFTSPFIDEIPYQNNYQFWNYYFFKRNLSEKFNANDTLIQFNERLTISQTQS